MQFLSNLFGGSATGLTGVAFALGLVLVLIVMSVWALKFIFQASGTVARSRVRRLSVVESLPVDGRRQVLLIRRDNVEYLVLTGGGQDVLLESGIPAERLVIARPEVPAHAPPAAANNVGHRSGTAAAADPAATGGATANAARKAVARLREMTHSGNEGSPVSLRHTGLMRPAGRKEVIPGYFEGGRRDSAKTTPVMEAKGGDGSVSRDGYRSPRK